MKIPHWETLSWARDRFGTAGAILSYPQLLLTHLYHAPAEDQRRNRPNLIKRFVDEGNKPHVFLRAGTSDLTVWDEVFIEREYDIDAGDPKFIIDAGAHIGLASVFLAMRYPNAKIVALELDARNWSLMLSNVRPFSNVIPLHAGIWHQSGSLKVSNPDAATWSYRAEEGGDTRALTVQDIMQIFGVERVDLMKIDIEGGEKQLLEHSSEWIDRIGTMVIETHDRYVPGCTDALKNAIAGRKVTHSVSGESTVLRFA